MVLQNKHKAAHHTAKPSLLTNYCENDNNKARRGGSKEGKECLLDSNPANEFAISFNSNKEDNSLKEPVVGGVKTD